MSKPRERSPFHAKALRACLSRSRGTLGLGLVRVSQGAEGLSWEVSWLFFLKGGGRGVGVLGVEVLG